MDISWIQEAKQLSNIQKSALPEHLEKIKIENIFIDKKNEIIEKTKSIFPLSNSNILNKDKLLKIINENNKKNFKLHDILLFHITVPPEELRDFVEYEIVESKFLSIFNLESLNQIVIHPSIFIFHPYTTLYFIYKENTIIAKSALKTNKSHVTKKVRIKVPRHTKRNH